MAWGWTRCPVPLTVRGTQALVPLTVRGSDAKLIAARRRLAEEDDREDHERDVEAGVPVAVAAAIVNASPPAEEEDRNDNYVEDLAEDVGPRDRRIPVWKSDFRRPGRAARAQRHRRNPISLADFHAAAHVTTRHPLKTCAPMRPQTAATTIGQFCFGGDWEISEARRFAVRQSRFDDASSDTKTKRRPRTCFYSQFGCDLRLAFSLVS